MDNPETPKKIYRRKSGRKPQIVKSADEFCRVCKCALKTKYGSLGSFVNVFKPCQREGFQQLVVADLCRRAGINLLKDTALSSRICTKCFRKVCTFSSLFDLLSEAINKSIHVESEEIVVTKRAVSYTPGKSPSRKSRREDDETKNPSERKRPPASRRRLLAQTVAEDQADKENSCPCESSLRVHDSNFLAHVNIDDLPDNTTSVKVLVLMPNGNVTVRTPSDKATICLIKNLALKRWQAAANAFLVHEPTREDLLIALNRSVNKEFRDYCRSETILKGRDVDELAAFSNTLVIKETEVYLPLWNACIRGSCGTDLEGDKTATNIIALATATAARHRVKDLSAFHYRISTLLCHGGISFEGAVQLNRLGICMSPQQMVHLQRVMGKDHDAKVQMCKNNLEKNESACLFLQKKEKENSVKNYRFYSENVMKVCLSEISSTQAMVGEDLPTEDVVNKALLAFKQRDIPFYKYVHLMIKVKILISYEFFCKYKNNSSPVYLGSGPLVFYFVVKSVK